MLPILGRFLEKNVFDFGDMTVVSRELLGSTVNLESKENSSKSNSLLENRSFSFIILQYDREKEGNAQGLSCNVLQR